MLVALALSAGGFAQTPLLVAVILSASLGVMIPVLKDAGEIATPFGQLVVAAGTIADFGAIILLSILFTGKGGTTSTLLLIGALLGLAAALYVAVTGAERSRAVTDDLLRLQDTTAQIRVRGALVVVIAFAALAEQLGPEVILGAFAAGAVLTLVDRDRRMTHPLFRTKLEAIGFGVFIPVFFVSSGVRFDLDALLSSSEALLTVPLLLAAELGLMGAAESAALVCAGLLSVVIFPLAGLTLLRGGGGTMPAAQVAPGDQRTSTAT